MAMDISIKRPSIYPPPMKGEFQEETERKLVKAFNESQPNMVHKLKKVHLMRN